MLQAFSSSYQPWFLKSITGHYIFVYSWDDRALGRKESFVEGQYSGTKTF
jgi:hypothetical protein